MVATLVFHAVMAEGSHDVHDVYVLVKKQYWRLHNEHRSILSESQVIQSCINAASVGRGSRSPRKQKRSKRFGISSAKHISEKPKKQNAVPIAALR